MLATTPFFTSSLRRLCEALNDSETPKGVSAPPTASGWGTSAVCGDQTAARFSAVWGHSAVWSDKAGGSTGALAATNVSSPESIGIAIHVEK